MGVTDLLVTGDETILRGLVGREIFRQGREIVDAGRVTGARWHAEGSRAFGQVNTSKGARTAMVMAHLDGDGTVLALKSHCTCAARSAVCPRRRGPACLAGAGNGTAPACAVDPSRSDTRLDRPRHRPRSRPGSTRLACSYRRNPSRAPHRRPASGLQFELTTQDRLVSGHQQIRHAHPLSTPPRTLLEPTDSCRPIEPTAVG